MSSAGDDLFAAVPRGEGAAEGPASRVQTVRELTRRIEGQLSGLGRVSVEGEISRITRAASGHLYFDLKDLDAKLACTIWKSQVASAARFELREGLQVVAHGKLDVYAPRGTYSLNVQRLEPAGIGALLAELERRKQELKQRGWFDRKRPIPAFPRRIGVATSRDGAAFQDFLRTRTLRWPLYPVLLAHTPVQGAGAAAEIARALGRLDQAGVDVIVLCRGGGSLEDLWAFNEPAVAEALWNSRTPVVCGVGHETDVTLADLVADRRAHTPTDAAQVVIPERAALVEELLTARDHLARAVDLALEERGQRLSRAAGSRVLRDPRTLVGMRRERLGRLSSSLGARAARRLSQGEQRVFAATRALERASPAARLAAAAARLQSLRVALAGAAVRLLERRQASTVRAAAQLEALSPLGILARGYSITSRADGGVLLDAAAAAPGEVLSTRLRTGSLISRVEGPAAGER